MMKISCTVFYPLSCIPGFTAHALIPAGYFSIIGLINIFPAAKTYGCNM